MRFEGHVIAAEHIFNLLNDISKDNYTKKEEKIILNICTIHLTLYINRFSIYLLVEILHKIIKIR